MKSKSLVACLIAASIALPGLHAEEASTRDQTGKAFSMKDSLFIKKAAKGGMMEVAMGERAEKEGKSEEVKNIGARMVTDHTKANKELMALAEKKGLKFPAEKSKSEKMSGADFDEKYLALMVKDHEKDVAEFEKAAQDSDDAEVKAFAEKTLPTLKEHLTLVKDAQAKTK